MIEELKKNGVSDIVYVGRNKTLEGDRAVSVESQILPNLGVKFIPITTGRLQRTLTPYTLTSLIKIPFGFLQAFYILLKEKPDVVLSFGGYVAVPIVIAAWLLSIPVIVHEQTLVSGLANQISSLFAGKVARSFPVENKDKKIVITGNPIRQEILNPEDILSKQLKEFFKEARKEKVPVLFITGGNQGSHVINMTVEKVLPQLTKQFFIIHQTGDSKYQDWERLNPLQDDRYLIFKFIGSEIGAILKNVDLVISRAGANTLTELAFLGKPTLVVPLPYLYKDEQNQNARFFEKLGLVQVILQSSLSPDALFRKIVEMSKNLDTLKVQAQKAKKEIILDAAKKLALETILLAKKER